MESPSSLVPQDNDDDDDASIDVVIRTVDNSQNKGNYRLVPVPFEVEANEDTDIRNASLASINVLNRNFMPDEPWKWRGLQILDLQAVRFLKFFSWTGILMLLIHYLVRILDWGYDDEYTLKDLILFDGNMIVLDVMVFYCVGRLFRQRAVDYLAWQLVAFMTAVVSSWLLRNVLKGYSMSLYQMHCRWPWWLWLMFAIVTPLCVAVAWLHVQYAAQHGIWVQKLVEGGLSFVILFLPYASDPSFHLHHWYLAWLLGMHANLDVWWSRATMAFYWGFYINGIAVYGRDPILTCAITYYQSKNQECPYLACYQPETSFQDNNATNTALHHDYKPMVEPDWRNCSSYLP